MPGVGRGLPGGVRVGLVQSAPPSWTCKVPRRTPLAVECGELLSACGAPRPVCSFLARRRPAAAACSPGRRGCTPGDAFRGALCGTLSLKVEVLGSRTPRINGIRRCAGEVLADVVVSPYGLVLKENVVKLACRRRAGWREFHRMLTLGPVLGFSPRPGLPMVWYSAGGPPIPPALRDPPPPRSLPGCTCCNGAPGSRLEQPPWLTTTATNSSWPAAWPAALCSDVSPFTGVRNYSRAEVPEEVGQVAGRRPLCEVV